MSIATLASKSGRRERITKPSPFHLSSHVLPAIPPAIPSADWIVKADSLIGFLSVNRASLLCAFVVRESEIPMVKRAGKDGPANPLHV